MTKELKGPNNQDLWTTSTRYTKTTNQTHWDARKLPPWSNSWDLGVVSGCEFWDLGQERWERLMGMNSKIWERNLKFGYEKDPHNIRIPALHHFTQSSNWSGIPKPTAVPTYSPHCSSHYSNFSIPYITQSQSKKEQKPGVQRQHQTEPRIVEKSQNQTPNKQ